MELEGQVALVTGRSRWARLKRRLPLTRAAPSERKTVYQ